MSGFSVSPHRVMVQKARATGFDGQFYADEKAAAMQLLWEHLVHAPDQVAALAKLRAELDQHLTDFSYEWVEKEVLSSEVAAANPELEEAEKLLWLAHKNFGDSKAIRSGERGASDRQQAQNRIYQWLDKRRTERQEH